MGNTESILPLHLVTSYHIKEVIDMQSELSQIKYWRDRHARFRQIVYEMTEEAKWLLTFAVWFTTHNTRHKAVTESRYYMIEPSTTTDVQFVDFIKLIQQYSRKFVCNKNEEPIIKFLGRCDREHFGFYLSLLSKEFPKTLPTAEVYDVLDLGCIDLQEIYGPIEILQTNFSELDYPVAVMLLPDPDYKLSVQSREPRRTFSYYQNEGKLKATKDLLVIDSKYISTPRYTLVGYSDILEVKVRRKQMERFILHPVDYFDTFKEFRMYLKGRKNAKTLPFKERIAKLKAFLDANYLRQISKTQIGYAENEQELAQQVAQLYPKEGAGYLVVTDNNTARTGKASAVPVRNTYGTIRDLWVDGDVPRGFHVWFNGGITQVPFDFSGANNALLNKPGYVNLKLLEFTYIKIGSLPIYIGKSIHWDRLQWKNYKHSSGAYIEKCVLCGGTDHPHKHQGLCRVCEINIRYYYGKYGRDSWITPSNSMKAKRFISGWESKLLNMMNASFKDCFLEAREDGCWRFRYDQARADHYQKYLDSKETNVS